MNWNELLITVVNSLVGLALTAVSVYFTAWLNNKVKNDKLKQAITEVKDIAFNSVLTVKQTFVDSLKKEGKFDAAAQKEAFNKAYMDIESTVSQGVKQLIENHYGDFQSYITQLIESNVANTKQEVSYGILEQPIS